MNREKSLITLLEDLRKTIRKAIENNIKFDSNKNNTWQQTTAWEEVIKNLSQLISKYQTDVALANDLIGLDKYIDLYSLEESLISEKDIILDKVAKIVNNSITILKNHSNTPIKQLCRKHEDYACELKSPSPRFIYSPSGLPITAAVNFWSPYILKIDLNKYPNLQIKRVIDDNNNPFGSYWFIGNLPKKRKCWRSRYAVLAMWSMGTKYVKLNIPYNAIQKLECWLGFAASQPVPFEECILYGGWHQVWIPPNIINQLKTFVIKPQIIKHW